MRQKYWDKAIYIYTHFILLKKYIYIYIYIYLLKCLSQWLMSQWYMTCSWGHLRITSSTAQGGGGSFKNRKPIGETGCCESGIAERSHWWSERWLISLTISLSFSDYLPTYLPIYLSLSLFHLITYLSIFLPIYLSVYLSSCLPVYLSIYLSICLLVYLWCSVIQCNVV